MAITGTVKIELFDATTGRKTDEVISSNMVTNAVRNIVNPDRAIVDGGYTHGMDSNWMQKWVVAISPIGRKLFKGIMLFNKKLTENVDNIIPDQSTREAMVGCAGGGSSLAGNNFRGTYNTTESRQLSNGYSHVWDFSTNQANGVISAVALTSEWGGEMGWKATEYEMAKSLMPITGNRTWMDSVSTADIPSGASNDYFFKLTNKLSVPSGSETDYSSALCTVFVAGGYLFEVVLRNDRKLMEVYRKSLTNALSLVETLYTNPVEFSGVTPSLREGATKFEFTSVDGFCAEDALNVDICHVQNGVMFVSYSISKATSPEDTDRLIINTTTLALVDGELTVSTLGITSALATQISTSRGRGNVSTAASDGEYLYVYSNKKRYLNKIYKIKINGTEESEIELPFTAPNSTGGVCLGSLLDTIFVCSKEPTLLYLLNSTKTAFVSGLSAQVYDSSRGRVSYFLTQLTPPWVLAVEDMKLDSFTGGIYPMVVSPYLATINNLQTAVTKTASKTMKITYTIQNT